MRDIYRPPLLGSLAVLSVWILLHAGRMAWQPLVLDEIDFMLAAQDWPAHASAVPHPPGFVHLLRLLFAVFGESVAVARLPGLVSALATLWLLPLFVRVLFPDHPRAPALATWAVWFYGLASLTTQNAMLVDIDNTVLVPVVLGLFALWFACRHRSGWRPVIMLGAALCLTLWLKLPPAALFVLSVALAARWDRDARALRVAVLGGLAGLVLFVATFALHARLTGFPLGAMRYPFHRMSQLGDLRTVVTRAPQTAGVFVLWLTVPGAILAGVASLKELRERASAPAARLRALAVFVVLSLLFYTLVLGPPYGYPKYQAVLMPLLAVMVAALLSPADVERSRPVRAVLVGAGFLLILAQVAWGDPLWGIYRLTLETGAGDLGDRLAGSLRASAGIVWLPLLVTLLLSLLLLVGARLKARRAVLVGLAVTALAQSGGTVVAQAGARYSTRYHYGTDLLGLQRACRTLGERLRPGSFIIAPKDILFETGFPGQCVTDVIWEGRSPALLLATLAGRRVDAIVCTRREENRGRGVLDDERVRSVLARDFTRDQLGEYALWWRNSVP